MHVRAFDWLYNISASCTFVSIIWSCCCSVLYLLHSQTGLHNALGLTVITASQRPPSPVGMQWWKKHGRKTTDHGVSISLLRCIYTRSTVSPSSGYWLRLSSKSNGFFSIRISTSGSLQTLLAQAEAGIFLFVAAANTGYSMCGAAMRWPCKYQCYGGRRCS